mmetsp:Transcript_9896/g.12219  ORF Transcript_9896/g.12219 Transcript_9896/m.12219 type:complete len:288 (+) Transcript_9896:10-873(+)
MLFFATLGVACGQISKVNCRIPVIRGLEHVRNILPSDMRAFSNAFSAVSPYSYRLADKTNEISEQEMISAAKLNQIWRSLGGHELDNWHDDHRVSLVALGAPALEFEELKSFQAMASNYYKDKEVEVLISATPAAINEAVQTNPKIMNSLLDFGVHFLPDDSTQTMLRTIQSRNPHLTKSTFSRDNFVAYSGLVTNSPTIAMAASRYLPQYRRSTNFSGIVGCLDAAVTARPPTRRPLWLLNQRRGYSTQKVSISPALAQPLYQVARQHLTSNTVHHLNRLARRLLM